jgi:PAS domain S-box-containing protein
MTLRNSVEAKNYDINDSIADIYLVLDSGLHITKWNDASNKIKKYSNGDVIGKTIHELLTPTKIPITEELCKEVLKTQTPRSVISKDLQFHGMDLVLFNIYPLNEGLNIIVKDITDYKTPEPPVDKVEYRFQSTLDNMLEGCAILDYDWNYLYANEVNAKHSRKNKDELIGANIFTVFPGFETTLFYETFNKTMKERIPQQIEAEFTYPDGSSSWFETRSVPVPEGIFIQSIDVSERKQNEEALLRYQSILNQSERIARIGSWWIELIDLDNMNANPVRWSDGVYSILGYEPQSFPATYGLFFNHIHPDDKEIFINELESAVKNGLMFHLEHRIIRKDGVERILLEQAEVHKYDNGIPHRIVGAVKDVTDIRNTARDRERLLIDIDNERNKLKDLLFLSEQNAAELNAIIESIPDALFIGDINGMRLCNDKALKLMGAESLSELQKRIKELRMKFNVRWPESGNPLKEEELPFNRALNGENVIQEVLATNAKTNKDLYLRIACAPVKLNGRVIAAVAIESDITEKIQTEKIIKASLLEKEVLLQEIFHRTKNNMQVISSIIGLKANSIGNKESIAILEDMKSKIQTISIVHQMLYQSNNLSRVDLAEYIKNLVHLLINNYLSNPEKVTFELDLVQINVLIDFAVPCGLIINELITNSLKYAFPGDRRGKISISLSQTEDGLIEIRVSDNGIGMRESDMRNSKGLGLKLFKILSEQLQAKTVLESKNGVSWYVAFKDKYYSERV